MDDLTPVWRITKVRYDLSYKGEHGYVTNFEPVVVEGDVK